MDYSISLARLRWSLLLCSLFFVGFVAPVYAWETDNFHCRYDKLTDVTPQLNAEVNRRMQHVLTKGWRPRRNKLKRPKKINQEAHLRTLIRKKGLRRLPPHVQRRARRMVRQFMAENNISSFDEGMGKWMQLSPTKKASSGGGAGGGQKDTRLKERELVGCDKATLHSAMRAALASSWFGNMETWAEDQNFPKCLPKKTVYDGFGLFDAPVLKAVGLNYTVKVGSTRIGVDKLSHFMTEGYDYYQKQLQGGTMEQILDIGRKEEEGGYGIKATGIKSYGDLSANYHGYLFWKNLTDGKDPYIVCEGDRWRQARSFDWGKYVNPTFDESINCSEFKTKEMQEVVDRNVAELQRENNSQPYRCPLEPEKCQQVEKYIPDNYVMKRIVHPRCLGVTPPSTEKGNDNEVSY